MSISSYGWVILFIGGFLWLMVIHVDYWWDLEVLHMVLVDCDGSL